MVNSRLPALHVHRNYHTISLYFAGCLHISLPRPMWRGKATWGKSVVETMGRVPGDNGVETWQQRITMNIGTKM